MSRNQTASMINRPRCVLYSNVILQTEPANFPFRIPSPVKVKNPSIFNTYYKHFSSNSPPSPTSLAEKKLQSKNPGKVKVAINRGFRKTFHEFSQKSSMIPRTLLRSFNETIPPKTAASTFNTTGVRRKKSSSRSLVQNLLHCDKNRRIIQLALGSEKKLMSQTLKTPFIQPRVEIPKENEDEVYNFTGIKRTNTCIGTYFMVKQTKGRKDNARQSPAEIKNERKENKFSYYTKRKNYWFSGYCSVTELDFVKRTAAKAQNLEQRNEASVGRSSKLSATNKVEGIAKLTEYPKAKRVIILQKRSFIA